MMGFWVLKYFYPLGAMVSPRMTPYLSMTEGINYLRYPSTEYRCPTIQPYPEHYLKAVSISALKVLLSLSATPAGGTLEALGDTISSQPLLQSSSLVNCKLIFGGACIYRLRLHEDCPWKRFVAIDA